MRAATVIVGAIAVSSCLIALSLVLTSGSDSSTQPVPPPAQKETTQASAGSGASASPPASGPVQCNVEVTVEGASCLLGKSVLAAFESAGAGAVTAVDPQSNEEVTLECGGTAPTICSSDGVTVYLAPTEP